MNWKHAFKTLILFLAFFSTTIIRSVATRRYSWNNLENSRPIIGILSQEISYKLIPPHIKGKSYIAASYVKYIESAGARVVPILTNRSQAEIQMLFRSVNGLLFPGGGAKFFTSSYFKNAAALYKMAMDANRNGDYFPIWGTCLGFETLNVITAGIDVTSSSDADDVSLPLNFTQEAFNSRMFGNAPVNIMKVLEKTDITYNHHGKCVTPEEYQKVSVLKDFYKILATSNDKQGKTFISTMEAFKYPIYGTQWHPEKNPFEWSTKLQISHTNDAIQVSQYVADFFVDEARKSQHKFNTSRLLNDYLIYNYTPIYTGDAGFFEQAYIFN